jgi:hypothetical protein
MGGGFLPFGSVLADFAGDCTSGCRASSLFPVDVLTQGYLSVPKLMEDPALRVAGRALKRARKWEIIDDHTPGRAQFGGVITGCWPGLA